MSKKLPPKVLVVEHDEVLNSIVSNNIERAWFDVTRVFEAEQATKAAQEVKPHVVVISSRLKGVPAAVLGVKTRKIEGLAGVPLIFIIDKSEPKENYINEYLGNLVETVTRPVDSAEILDKIRVLLRQSKPVFQDKVLTYKDISMDLSTYQVVRSNRKVHLGPTEFKILQLFIQNPKGVYSREQIIDYVWGKGKDIAYRTIDVHVNRIRKMLDPSSGASPMIRTIRSAGYGLE